MTVTTALAATWTEIAGLSAYVVGSPDPAVIAVLLHGFGASAEDLAPLATELEVPSARFVFPDAPLEISGVYGAARAWWMLDLARLEDELARGAPRDYRDEVPAGLPEARAQVLRLLDQLEARFATPQTRLVLGGFSQGAMLALDVALHRARPPDGLVLLSGTLVNEAEWRPRFPSLRGVPVLLSHGRTDGLLPYAAAESLRDRLRAAGAALEWHPFLGGHEIPRAVLAALADFLRARAAG